jgi:hypothetical protein
LDLAAAATAALAILSCFWFRRFDLGDLSLILAPFDGHGHLFEDRSFVIQRRSSESLAIKEKHADHIRNGGLPGAIAFQQAIFDNAAIRILVAIVAIRVHPFQQIEEVIVRRSVGGPSQAWSNVPRLE